MMTHKVVFGLIDGKEIICKSTKDNYKTKIAEVLRMMENYPNNFVDLSNFFDTPDNNSIYVKGASVSSVSESSEKEVLVE